MKKILYVDCSCGISGDMAFKALLELCGEAEAVRQKIETIDVVPHHHHEHTHGEEKHHEHTHDHREQHDHEGGHTHEEIHHHHEHISYKDVKHIIAHSGLTEGEKQRALDIYAVIAKAEAKVHESTIEDVGFHEVGRIEAIRNIAGIAICVERLGVEEIYCSPVHDGKGFIHCSHGLIPVPVPAVMAMREDCDYIFVTDEVETEMVTPSGLGVLMGLGAVCTEHIPQGDLAKSVEVKGTRDIGKDGGLKISLMEVEGHEI
ncbi:nickel insertion protein [Clostridium aminobutyricum]|uniref:DUF111 family protein n=1 Tax=Clostridium aminobutyricum TaxID=33953 RepID=A0A939IFU2_CLOAM|nr:nickel insertion protein [Clostridium aminobutyricum]MBN7771910.1 DUF111 family protein [Clostridium aminobutyricum]